MNDRPTPEPLASDVADELLSALLDDEFDAAAADAGMQPDEARARLAATPGVAERTRALEAARASLAGPQPPLDPVTRRRLVDRALPVEFHDERNRVGQWLLGAAGVAAAIAIVFALLVLPGRNSGGDDSASRAASPTGASTANRATTVPQPSNPTIDDERALQQFVAAERSRTGNFAASDAAARAGSTADSAPENSQKVAGTSALLRASRCNPLIASELGLGDARLVQTSAVTHDGKPAIVAIYVRAGDVLGFLYDPTTCKVLISTFSK